MALFKKVTIGLLLITLVIVSSHASQPAKRSADEELVGPAHKKSKPLQTLLGQTDLTPHLLSDNGEEMQEQQFKLFWHASLYGVKQMKEAILQGARCSRIWETLFSQNSGEYSDDIDLINFMLEHGVKLTIHAVRLAACTPRTIAPLRRVLSEDDIDILSPDRRGTVFECGGDNIEAPPDRVELLLTKVVDCDYIPELQRLVNSYIAMTKQYQNQNNSSRFVDLQRCVTLFNDKIAALKGDRERYPQFLNAILLAIAMRQHWHVDLTPLISGYITG